MTDTPAREPALTRYRILTSEDGGRTWLYIGAQDAQSRDQALRKQYSEPPDGERLAVAVPESSFRATVVKSRMTTSLTEQPLPGDEEVEEPAVAEDPVVAEVELIPDTEAEPVAV